MLSHFFREYGSLRNTSFVLELSCRYPQVRLDTGFSETSFLHQSEFVHVLTPGGLSDQVVTEQLSRSPSSLKSMALYSLLDKGPGYS